jgi:hypothetical protein
MRFCQRVWKRMLSELAERKFVIRWIEVAAKHVGSPQTRRRWFALAIRGSPFTEEGFADILPAHFGGFTWQALNLKCYGGFSGVNFNPPGRPPPARWLCASGIDLNGVEARLRILGHAVVPLQAFLAARVVSTLIDRGFGHPQVPFAEHGLHAARFIPASLPLWSQLILSNRRCPT